MAYSTPLSYRNLVIYEVFVRNHSRHGTLKAVEADLPRIRSMGVDTLWFMPIHPIGALHRKGRLGSPYSVKDHRAVNSEYGTMDDFIRIVESAHSLGMQVIIDVVFNHAAYDSPLVRDHLDWFHQGIDGGPFRAPTGWTDIVGMKHPNPDLSAYLVETLLWWMTTTGLDGFRCDVASLLPLDLWQDARKAVNQIRPNALWLAESVSASFIASRRTDRLTALTDSELYQVFDLTYDHDIWPLWRASVARKATLTRYLEILRFQDCLYPTNYVKLRCVENHDQPRIMAFAANEASALAWTAFEAFNKGAFLIYAGQESGARDMPSLFDRTPIEWGEYRLQSFFTKLTALKKEASCLYGDFVLVFDEPAIQAVWNLAGKGLYGIFNVNSVGGRTTTSLPDGEYEDLLSGEDIRVTNGTVALPHSAVIVGYEAKISLEPFYSVLLDYDFGAS